VNDSPEPVDLSPSRAELIARVRARGRQIRARRRLGFAGVTALVVIGIAAPAIAIGTRSSETHRIPPATVSTTRPPSTVDPRVDMSTSIELPDREVVSGSEVHATLVITNNTDQPVPLDTPGKCAGKWAILLRSPTASQDKTWTMECGAPNGTVLEPGANRFPFSIPTTYTTCSGDDSGATTGIVHCLPGPGGGVPPLPPGDYEAVLATRDPGFLPSAPPVPVRIVEEAPTVSDLGPLARQSGARSTKLLVPSGWSLKIDDGGGSGSGSTWTNPDNPKEQISGVTGVELGSWWETDGVKGSITPLIAAPGTQVQRVNYTTFLFHGDPPNGYPIDGVWIALVDANGPIAFVSASVQLPSALHSTATTILDRFISDTNARVPPYPGP
jgi:hypothetical protein